VRIADDGVAACGGRPNAGRRAVQNVRHGIDATRNGDLRAHGAASFFGVHHVVDVQNVHAKLADVRQQVFMVWKEVAQGKDDSRWLFLPALNLVKPIAPGDKRTSFAGSDFVYEDVSGRALWEDTHELIKETDTQYLIKNTPKNPGAVDFGEYTVAIDKTTFLPVKAEYLDKNGKLFRRVEAVKIEPVQGRPTVTESRVDDLLRGGHTVNFFSSIQYDTGLNEAIFTERFLRRPPREATK